MAGRLESVERSLDHIVHRLAVQLGELIEDQPAHLTKTQTRAYSSLDRVVLVSDPPDCTPVPLRAVDVHELPMTGAVIDPSTLTLRTPLPLPGLRWKKAKMLPVPALSQHMPVIGLVVRGQPGELEVLASVWRDSTGALEEWRDGIGRMVVAGRVRFVPPDEDLHAAVCSALRP